MKGYLPLFIDFSDKKVVIVGGGAVGYRKARYFCGLSEVVVVSRDFVPGLIDLQRNGLIKLVKREIKKDTEIEQVIDGAFLVISATDNPRLNRRIKDIAERRGILVNSATEKGNVVIPSIMKGEEYMVAVSTYGASPVLSRYLRIKIEEVIPEKMDSMVKLITEIRDGLKKEVKDQKTREKLLWMLVNDSGIWELLDDYSTAFDTAVKRLKKWRSQIW